MSHSPTPGPWNYWPHALHDPENGEPRYVVGPREFHTVADVRPGNSEDGLPEQTEANARLIAAAQEMLEILQTTRGNILSLGPAGSLPMPYRPWLEEIDRIITKATGKESE